MHWFLPFNMDDLDNTTIHGDGVDNFVVEGRLTRTFGPLAYGTRCVLSFDYRRSHPTRVTLMLAHEQPNWEWLASATKEQVFGAVCAGFAAQQWKRATQPNTGRCMYRTLDGLRCAVGQVIPDRMYNPSFEGKGADYIFVGWSVQLYSVAVLKMLSELQSLHDKVIASPHGLYMQFQSYANTHGLTPEFESNAGPCPPLTA